MTKITKALDFYVQRHVPCDYHTQSKLLEKELPINPSFLYIIKKQYGVVAHAIMPVTLETEAGESQV